MTTTTREVIELPHHLSPSQVRDLSKCSAQYFLRRAFPPTDDAGYFILGHAVHGSIEDAIATGILNSMTVDLAHEIIDKRIEEAAEVRWASRTNEDNIHEIAKMCVDHWFRSVHPSSTDQIDRYKELRWPPMTEVELWVPDTEIKCRIDALFWTEDGAPVVVDWKTGSSYRSSPVQLWMNWYALRKGGTAKNRHPFRAWYHHLRAKGGGKIQEADPYPGDAVIEHMIAGARAKKDNREFVPNPGWYCKSCRVRDRCPAFAEDPDKALSDMQQAVKLVNITQGGEK